VQALGSNRQPPNPPRYAKLLLLRKHRYDLANPLPTLDIMLMM
jgi:hypothetical protein